ncbi:MAG: sugar phosphate nucleotidyltransferase, partial [Candidatus Bathyarchaeota archaeon]|nr:sugar phosphate nucleotidyltransferase [Candidatus Bathyarchaeota archaeon]
LRYHQNRRATATVALASGFTVRVGLADVEDSGKIRGFVEKPTLEKPVSIGILVFKGETLKEVDRLKMSQRGLDLMGNVIPRLIKAGRPVYGYLTDAFWYDVGSTEAYEKLNHKLVDKMFSHLFQ